MTNVIPSQYFLMVEKEIKEKNEFGLNGRFDEIHGENINVLRDKLEEVSMIPNFDMRNSHQ